MKIISWNVNGLRAILSKNFFEFIQDYDPDILCLQETRLSKEAIPDLGLPQYGYKEFSCAAKAGYSGTAIFSKVPLQRIITHSEVEESLKIDEGRITYADLGKFHLVNVYVPNSQAELRRLAFRHDDWDVRFRHYLHGLSQQKPTLVCGDFNVAHQEIDLAHPENNHQSAGFTDEEREGFENFLKTGFVDVFRHFHPNQRDAYSWWSYRTNARARNVGWRIDYFLCSKELLPSIKSCEILTEVYGSDHAPVLLKI